MNQFCACQNDGLCERYQRPMHGRMRQICAGVNVDLGTAATFRDQWEREAKTQSKHTINLKSIPLLLKTGQSPGDALAMTAAIYSLHKSHPDKYVTAVESYWPDVFQYNPDVSAHLVPCEDTTTRLGMFQDIRMHYPAVHDSNTRGIHFMQGWCEFLGKALGISIPLLTNKPCLFFKDVYRSPIAGDYWIVCSGGKRDFTNKLWGHERYQEVVHRLSGRVKFIQVGGAKPIVPWAKETKGSQEDFHAPLDATENMIGKTTLRELFNLVRGSRGVLCGVSLLMHVAAALDKPAIVIAGGREPVAWNAYPLQQYLHTVGMLQCPDIQGKHGGACWRYRVRPLNDGMMYDENPCVRPAGEVPECMAMIRPAMVSDLILDYNRQYEGKNGSNPLSLRLPLV